VGTSSGSQRLPRSFIELAPREAGLAKKLPCSARNAAGSGFPVGFELQLAAACADRTPQKRLLKNAVQALSDGCAPIRTEKTCPY
jgi:hypothetical protein